MRGLATSKEVATYLGIHPQSMDRWASQGKGPRYTKIEGIRRYDWDDITAWVEQNKTATPADAPRWTCSFCGDPVTSNGYLITSVDQALLSADGADWGVFHNDCPSEIIRNPYTIEIERALTWPQLAGWIAHLWEKDWAHSTGVDRLLRKAGASS